MVASLTDEGRVHGLGEAVAGEHRRKSTLDCDLVEFVDSLGEEECLRLEDNLGLLPLSNEVGLSKEDFAHALGIGTRGVGVRRHWHSGFLPPSRSLLD